MSAYRFPVAPFGVEPGSPPMQEDGAEHVYSVVVKRPAANAGAAVLLQDGSVDPFFLGALDESSRHRVRPRSDVLRGRRLGP